MNKKLLDPKVMRRKLESNLSSKASCCSSQITATRHVRGTYLVKRDSKSRLYLFRFKACVYNGGTGAAVLEMVRGSLVIP